MKATFNFQVKIDDKQTSVVFGMEECKGVDIEVMNTLMKLFSETRAKAVKLLDKPTFKEKTCKTEYFDSPILVTTKTRTL